MHNNVLTVALIDVLPQKIHGSPVPPSFPTIFCLATPMPEISYVYVYPYIWNYMLHVKWKPKERIYTCPPHLLNKVLFKK